MKKEDHWHFHRNKDRTGMAVKQLRNLAHYSDGAVAVCMILPSVLRMEVEV
jgi:hypothetical protein